MSIKYLVVFLGILLSVKAFAQSPTFTVNEFYTGCFGEGISNWDSVVQHAAKQKKIKIIKREKLANDNGIVLDFRRGSESWNITKNVIFFASVNCTYKDAKECEKAFQEALKGIQNAWKFISIKTDTVPPPPPSDDMTIAELRALPRGMEVITFHDFTSYDACFKKQSLSIYKKSEKSFTISIMSR